MKKKCLVPLIVFVLTLPFFNRTLIGNSFGNIEEKVNTAHQGLEPHPKSLPELISRLKSMGLEVEGIAETTGELKGDLKINGTIYDVIMGASGNSPSWGFMVSERNKSQSSPSTNSPTPPPPSNGSESPNERHLKALVFLAWNNIEPTAQNLTTLVDRLAGSGLRADSLKPLKDSIILEGVEIKVLTHPSSGKIEKTAQIIKKETANPKPPQTPEGPGAPKPPTPPSTTLTDKTEKFLELPSGAYGELAVQGDDYYIIMEAPERKTVQIYKNGILEETIDENWEYTLYVRGCVYPGGAAAAFQGGEYPVAYWDGKTHTFQEDGNIFGVEPVGIIWEGKSFIFAYIIKGKIVIRWLDLEGTTLKKKEIPTDSTQGIHWIEKSGRVLLVDDTRRDPKFPLLYRPRRGSPDLLVGENGDPSPDRGVGNYKGEDFVFDLGMCYRPRVTPFQDAFLIYYIKKSGFKVLKFNP